uniref:P-type domain-containing protein n=1 Tax=Chrysemys picta bellii TaxID=8478 RepID=A0A8C3FBD2_CHRPI
ALGCPRPAPGTQGLGGWGKQDGVGAAGTNRGPPSACTQHPSLRTPCGGNAENFYPSQCLQRKCCHANGTCFHRAIDGERPQSQPHPLRGALEPWSPGSQHPHYLCSPRSRLKGTRAAGKETGKPKSTSDAEAGGEPPLTWAAAPLIQ